MDKEFNIEDIEKIVDKINGNDEPDEAADEVVEETVQEEATVETAQPTEAEEPASPWRAYVPRFTEVSERYRMRGDARIRQRLGLKPLPNSIMEDAEEETLDPTAEFEEDLNGVEAKVPENKVEDESDESISVMKFSTDDSEETPEEKQVRVDIENLLKVDDYTLEDKAEEAEEAQDDEVVEETEETNEEIPEIAEEEESVMADPDDDAFGVFDFNSKTAHDEIEDAPEGASDTPVSTKTGKGREHEFTNPNQRDSFKDKFLDSIMSVKIRLAASAIFAFALFLIEILCATKSISYKLLPGATSYTTLALVDFMLAACIFVVALPEIIRSLKYLGKKNLMPDVLPVPAFLVLGAYTLTVGLTNATAYPLFGLLFAFVSIPTLLAALYRTQADFISFKMISQPEDKHIIDKKNTREMGPENMALDGIVDEYKSKTARTFRTSFVSDFFKNSTGTPVLTKHIAFIFGIPFGTALVASAVAYFLSWNPVTAVAVLALTVMLGCPAYAILANKVSFFFTQKAAELSDSTAIGEDAYHNFSAVDVFAFDDTDMFGPDDVNLKRFMLYGERENMEKVMRQMCALFASVGGPLDYMFSNAIDNRARHKSAENVIIEDDGICGDVAGHRICAGSEDYMRRNGIALPSTAVSAESGVSLDTIKVMYAAEDGEVYAKFYIRYSFSEEFTMILSSLREAGITPLVYSRDPNVSNELLDTFTTGSGTIRVVKLYNPLGEEKVYSRVSASMVTYGDKLDAANMVLLSKKYKKFSDYIRFSEICGMSVGVVLALVLSFIGFSRLTVIISAIWQVVWCLGLHVLSKTIFLKSAELSNEDNQ